MATTTSNVQSAYQIDKLSSSKCLIWNVKMQMLLNRFELWTMVDKNDPNPRIANVALQATWKLKDSKACFDLILHYSDQQIQLVITLKVSKEVWEKLKATYEQSSMQHKQQFTKDLCHFLYQSFNLHNFFWKNGKLFQMKQLLLVLHLLDPKIVCFCCQHLCLHDIHSSQHKDDFPTKHYQI
jgi:hypothetical protein